VRVLGSVRRMALVATAVLFAAMVISPLPAGAWCNPGHPFVQGNFFAGWDRYIGSTTGGIYGNISIYDPYVNYGDVSGWNMLDDGSHYAQIGYLVHTGAPGSPTVVFTEWNAPTGFDYEEFPMVGGNPVEFKVLYGNTPGRFTYYAGGVYKWSNDATFTPNDGQNYGELQAQSDQMLGAKQNHVVLSNVHLYFSAGWKNFDGSSSSSNSSWWGSHKDSSVQNEIWDNVCNN
jgi:hypothetical protein